MELSKHHLDMSEIIQKGLTFDHKKKEGTIFPNIEEGLLEKIAPADLDLEQVKKWQDFRTDLAPAFAHAVGKKSIPELKKHSAVERVEVVLPLLGKDTVTATFDRSVQVPNRLADGTTDGTKTKYGSVQVKFSDVSTKNSGLFGTVKKMLSTEASEKLGDGK